MEEVNISCGTSALNVFVMYMLLNGLFFFCLLIRVKGCKGLSKWLSGINCNQKGQRKLTFKGNNRLQNVSVVTKSISVCF